MPYLPSLLLQRERDERLRRRLARGGGPSHLSGLGRSLGGERRGFEFALAEAQGRRNIVQEASTESVPVELSPLEQYFAGNPSLTEDQREFLIATNSSGSGIPGLGTIKAGLGAAENAWTALGRDEPAKPGYGTPIGDLFGQGAGQWWEDKVANPVQKVLLGGDIAAGEREPTLGEMVELLGARGAGKTIGSGVRGIGGVAKGILKKQGRDVPLPPPSSANPAVRAQAALSALKRRPVRTVAGAATLGALTTNTGRDVLLKGPANLALATAEHPGQMLGATASGVRDAALGIPEAVEEVGMAAWDAAHGDTERASEMWNMIKEDYSHRYGPLLDGDTAEFRKRALEDGGLAPFAFDSLIAAPGVSRLAGAGIRRGMLGSRAQARILEPRVPMRIGGNEHVNQPSRYRRPLGDAPENPLGRERSRGIIGAELQRLYDKRAVKRTAIGAGELAPRSKLPPFRTRPKRGSDPLGTVPATDAMAVVAHAAGEVVPANLIPPFNRFDAVRRNIAKKSARAQVGYKAEMLEVLGSEYPKATAGLTPDQRNAALTVAMKYGIDDPKLAPKILKDALHKIEVDRARLANVDPKHYGVEGRAEAEVNPNLLRGLMENADEAFTPELIAAAKHTTELQEYQLRGPKKMVDDPDGGPDLVPEEDAVWRARTDEEGGADPGVTLSQAEVRQHQQSGHLLGMGYRKNPDGTDMSKAELVEQKELWGKRDYGPDGESPKQYGERVRAGMKAQYGVTQIPGYVRSEGIRSGRNYSDFAKGHGHGATALEKRYGGILHALGVDEMSEAVIKRGLARGVKRKYQWQQVTDLVHSQALPATLNNGKGQSPKKNAEWLEKNGVDPDEWVQFYPHIFDEERRNAGIAAQGDVKRTASDADRRNIDDAITDDPQLAEVMKMGGENSAFQGIKARPGDYTKGTRGAILIKKSVHQEINAQIEGAQLFGRVWDKGMGGASGLILAMNVPWLGFQVLSNTAMSIVGGSGPMAWALGNQFFRELKRADPEAYKALAAELHFQTSGFQDAIKSNRLGKAAEAWETPQIRAMAMANRGFWESPLNPKSRFASKLRGDRALRMKMGDKAPTTRGDYGKLLNPLDLLFRFDKAQNTFFRKGMFYSQARRDLWGKMGQDTTRVLEEQHKMGPLLNAVAAIGDTRAGRSLTRDGRRAGTDQKIRNVQEMLRRDPRLVERHAKSVADYMGDWTSYTRAERMFLKRGLLFYGFLRFSLRMAFFTMPTKHPIMTGIVAQMGRLETDELRELLGEDANPWALGGIRTGENGENVWEMYRANPILNVLTEADDVRSAANVLPPLFQIAAAQLYQYDTFTGRPIGVGGIPAQGPHNKLSAEQHGRVFVNSLASMFFPTRELMKFQAGGHTQGADQLPFVPAPTHYSDEGDVAKRQKDKERAFESLWSTRMQWGLETFFPFIGHSSASLDAANEGVMAAKEQHEERKEAAQENIPTSRGSSDSESFFDFNLDAGDEESFFDFDLSGDEESFFDFDLDAEEEESIFDFGLN